MNLLGDIWHLLAGVLYVAVGVIIAAGVALLLWLAFLGFQVVQGLRKTD